MIRCILDVAPNHTSFIPVFSGLIVQKLATLTAGPYFEVCFDLLWDQQCFLSVKIYITIVESDLKSWILTRFF